jgi:hypothetical protein
LREAVAAVYRLVATRLERNFRYSAALAASRFEHFALPAVAFTAASAASAARTSRFAGRAAVGAAIGLIGKALAGEKFLLTGREGELTSTVYTGQRFINVHIFNESPSFGFAGYSWDPTR